MTTPSDDRPAQVLFVDDERPILSSLKRLFRPTGHKVHVANSGTEGLDVLASEPIDVVVSDMRMPNMDGAEFLSEVAERWPETNRMLLTGYAELSSAIEAINSGSISRYLTKPWQDDDIKLCIDQAIESKRLRDEKRRLEALTAQQNEKLILLNESLEEKVASRTRAIEAAKMKLSDAHDKLQEGFSATIEVFARLIQSRDDLKSRVDVAEDSRVVATKLGLSEKEIQSTYEAALLCDIGKLALPDEFVTTPYIDLAAPAQRAFQRHPVIAETTLVTLDRLAGAAAVIRKHAERLDGSGYPDKLVADDIPMTARILCVTKTYSDLLEGRLLSNRLTVVEAQDYLRKHSGTVFDESAVDQFIRWLTTRARKAKEYGEKKTTLGGLRPGMVMSRELRDEAGVLILGVGQRISDKLIDKLIQLQETMDEPFTLYVEQRL